MRRNIVTTYTIYGLLHPLTNNIFYVGETANLTERYYGHTAKRSDKNDAKHAIIQELRQDGRKPYLIIFEQGKMTKEDAVKIEAKYIEQCKKEGHALCNRNEGGNAPPSQRGRKATAKRIRLMFENSPLKKEVYQFDRKGNFIAKYPGVREAYRMTKIDHRSISQVAGGSKIRKSAGGFIWKYETEGEKVA